MSQSERWKEESLRQFTWEELHQACRNLYRLYETIGPKASNEVADILEKGWGNNPEVIRDLLLGRPPSLPGLSNPRAGEGRR